MAQAEFKADVVAAIASAEIDAIEEEKERAVESATLRAMEPHLEGPWYNRRLVQRTRGEADSHIRSYQRYTWTSVYWSISERHNSRIRRWAELLEAANGSMETGDGKVTLDHQEIALLRSSTKKKEPA